MLRDDLQTALLMANYNNYDEVMEYFLKEYGYIFTGTNSLGFRHGHVYLLEVKRHLFSKHITIYELNGLTCEYSNKENFNNNWQKVK